MYTNPFYGAQECRPIPGHGRTGFGKQDSWRFPGRRVLLRPPDCRTTSRTWSPNWGSTTPRAALYEADAKGYFATREKRFLVRKPCFDDPALWEQITPRVAAEPCHAPHHPLLYDLRDEPSLGSFTPPMDYCFCPHTLRAFREWLQTQYSSLAALNAEWETAFEKWSDVVPLTTFEIKDREKAALTARRPENYAAWADHRAFMDFSFAKAIDRLRSTIHRYDRDTPVGIAGVQTPSAWGGYDLWRLWQAVDWMEPYDAGNSRAILGSFLPARAPILATYFGSDPAKLRRTAWFRLLDGDRGAIVWDDDPERIIRKSAKDMPITQRGADFRDILSPIRAAAAQLRPLQRTGDRIAIHYSQASIRAQWMFDSRVDGNTWPRRLASYELTHSRLIQTRQSFVKAVEDLVSRPTSFRTSRSRRASWRGEDTRRCCCRVRWRCRRANARESRNLCAPGAWRSVTIKPGEWMSTAGGSGRRSASPSPVRSIGEVPARSRKAFGRPESTRR